MNKKLITIAILSIFLLSSLTAAGEINIKSLHQTNNGVIDLEITSLKAVLKKDEYSKKTNLLIDYKIENIGDEVIKNGHIDAHIYLIFSDHEEEIHFKIEIHDYLGGWHKGVLGIGSGCWDVFEEGEQKPIRLRFKIVANGVEETNLDNNVKTVSCKTKSTSKTSFFEKISTSCPFFEGLLSTFYRLIQKRIT